MDFEPGSRLQNLFSSSGGNVDAVVGQMGSDALNLPDEPGPAVTGRTPVVGQLRRDRDLPVLRDELGDMME